MDDDVIGIAVGLRQGIPICHPHQCHHCKATVDELGSHVLSCPKSEGSLPHHTAINSIIHRSLMVARIPSFLEPVGLSRSDGKRPDGVTIAHWKSVHPLVWDVTCPDTFATSYEIQATLEAGAVAALAEQKEAKYETIAPTHLFCPIAIETSGVFGPDAYAILCDLARRIKDTSSEPNSKVYLFQMISVVVQRGNAASVLGCAGLDLDVV